MQRQTPREGRKLCTLPLNLNLSSGDRLVSEDFLNSFFIGWPWFLTERCLSGRDYALILHMDSVYQPYTNYFRIFLIGQFKVS